MKTAEKEIGRIIARTALKELSLMEAANLIQAQCELIKQDAYAQGVRDVAAKLEREKAQLRKDNQRLLSRCNIQQARISQATEDGPWKEEDPRMLREQIRVSDIAFQHLHDDHKKLQTERDHFKSLAQTNWKMAEELAEVIPQPQPQGMSFGSNLWFSYDKLAGWDGDDEEARKHFYQTRVIAKGVMEYKQNCDETLARFQTLKQQQPK